MSGIWEVLGKYLIKFGEKLRINTKINYSNWREFFSLFSKLFYGENNQKKK